MEPAWITAMPKAEVHVHLEGSFVSTAVPVPTGGFADLAGLLAHLDRACALVTTEAQVEAAGYGVAQRASESGVRYVDLIWNPTHWPAWRDRRDDFLAALDRGITAAVEDGLPPVGVCVSLRRDQSAADAEALVDWLIERRPRPVVGLSIDGNEAAAGRTGPRFAAAFRRARKAGLRSCAHAGESSGPEGVVDAIDLLGAERIDHGIRALEDPGVVRRLADEGIPLDVCPTSNVRLGLVASAAAHPVSGLIDAGVRVSLNTDDPVLFDTTVEREYAGCASTFGWTRDRLASVARTSIESCFAPGGMREDLLRDLAAFLKE
jgi:adenosine deaminase